LHPFDSREQLEEFLRTAAIVEEKSPPRGSTLPRRLTLKKDSLQCDAAFKAIDERKFGLTRLEESTEFDFKDSWKFEVAAYEIDRLLSLGMVPVTVQRVHEGRRGSLQFWVEGCMDEAERKRRKIQVPNPVLWNWQIHKVRIFDQLIHNIDRNLGNLLITPEWKLIAIDHSRSFKSVNTLRAPEALQSFSRSLMKALGALDETALTEKCGEYLSSVEIENTLARRDRILEIYEALARKKGRGAITYP
jgi:hypothetical protein